VVSGKFSGVNFKLENIHNLKFGHHLAACYLSFRLPSRSLVGRRTWVCCLGLRTGLWLSGGWWKLGTTKGGIPKLRVFKG
jgi:hypothetical protein